MAIKRRSKVIADFSAVSMSDLIFLLLIFFMLTSTLVAPNAIKLLLPKSNSRTIENPPKLTISINENFNYFFQGVEMDEITLRTRLESSLSAQQSTSLRLESDRNVPVQYVVNVIDIVNDINTRYDTKHKVILATSPK